MMSDEDLLNSTRLAVAKERRKLYADLKYSSLFDYTVRELKYSEGAAGRRVQTVRLLRELPEIEAKIESGALSLTNVCLAQKHFRETKATRDEKLKVLSQLVNEEFTEFRFLADRELRALLIEVRSLVGPKGSPMGLAEFVREMALCTRDKLTTQRFGKKRDHTANPDSESDGATASHSDAGVRHSRYIPKATKDHVWQKAQGKCECCESQRNLEYEHIIPFALGGTSTPDNLKLLCKSCNLRRGVKTFGTHAMRRDAPPC